MTMRKVGVSFILLAATLAVAGGVTGASAQDWRRDYEYDRGPHRFGPTCEYRIRAVGSAPVALFGGGAQAHRASARSIADWEYEAARLFGPRYANWELAAGKEVRCDARFLRFTCFASAHPCRR
jgi:hypothetical protein